ncbi:hypothetical protein DN752_12295 [Echinicola strongylocentroti]|uniref:Outer membrane protein beta-barrel domain-containing protein n=1 Tax=Echinicola strongylocentroti TaxID=1795355 RepID=A0A2Z4IKF0_9BACT|nr:hypothetical protein [Echinicola strongylocentroti]AWW30843.1 hypothetical protein DN752_12295 [Echinicola strongylocentroti]
MTPKFSLVIGFLLLFGNQVNAQEETRETEDTVLKNRVVFSLGYTWIPAANELSETEADGGFFVPTVGFDYFRKVHERWEVGIMWDWELDHYMVNGDELERERAMLFALVANYELMDHWAVFAGAGVEFEKHENLAVLRMGTEYAVEMGQDWEFVPSFALDIKKGYNTWSLAVGFCKRF